MIETYTLVDNRVALKLKSDVKAVLLCKLVELCRYSEMVDHITHLGRNWIDLKLKDFQAYVPYKSQQVIEKALIDLEDMGYIQAIPWERECAYRACLSKIAENFPHIIIESDALTYEKPTEKILKNKKKKKLSNKYAVTAQDLQLAQAWIENAIQQPHSKERAKKWDAEEFAADLNKARSSVNLTAMQMRQVFLFMIDDDFWKDKCLVPKFLMKKGGNGNSKIANLVSAWQQSLRAKSKGFSYLRENYDTVIDTTSKPTGQEDDIDLFG